jgi:hypothetical protein
LKTLLAAFSTVAYLTFKKNKTIISLYEQALASFFLTFFIFGIIERMSENTVSTFRILVATDNHLGFKCRDCIRQSDSFDVFEEILKLATVLQVDFILHAGDLFDHHKPERSILYVLIHSKKHFYIH